MKTNKDQGSFPKKRSVGTVGAKIEAPKAPKRVGCGEGDFGSQIGEFWCKLGAFCAVHLKLV